MIPFSILYNLFPFLHIVDTCMYTLYITNAISLKKNDIIEKFFNPLLVRLLVIYQVYGLLFKFNSSKKKKMTT